MTSRDSGHWHCLYPLHYERLLRPRRHFQRFNYYPAPAQDLIKTPGVQDQFKSLPFGLLLLGAGGHLEHDNTTVLVHPTWRLKRLRYLSLGL